MGGGGRGGWGERKVNKTNNTATCTSRVEREFNRMGDKVVERQVREKNNKKQVSLVNERERERERERARERARMREREL